MQTPTKSHDLTPGSETESLHHQYGKRQVSESKKSPPSRKNNFLLTPFLLSIPVIFILSILISGPGSDISSTVTSEPILHEVVINNKPANVNLNVPVIRNDSITSNSSAKTLRAKK